MSSKEKGYVYILTNPSFREDWVKIGKSSRPVNLRSRELDNTAVPLPFEIFATIETVKYNEVEKLVHKTIDRLTDLRIRQNREFFNVPPQIALDIFRDIATTIDDALVVEYRDNKPLHPTSPLSTTDSPSISEDCENSDFISDDIETDRQPRKMTRARFRFSMIGVRIGEYVTFIPTPPPSRWPAITRWNMTGESTSSHRLLVPSCRKKTAMHLAHIKAQNISHITGAPLMILEKSSKKIPSSSHLGM